jgi:hypothetical protein
MRQSPIEVKHKIKLSIGKMPGFRRMAKNIHAARL